MTFGRVNPQFSLEDQQISGLGDVYYNLTEPALVEAALKRGEGSLGKGGAFLVTTGKFTGRSPKDKHVVKTDSVADSIWWENNAEMSPEGFDALYQDMIAHMQGKDYFVQDLVGGADPKHAINVRMVTELAWHGLFIRTMLRRPDAEALQDFTADFTVINCPSFQADPAKHNCRSETVIAMNFDRKMILIGGTEYAGENKKSVFTLLNYLLPEKGIMPMHCSANHATGNPVDTAVFFGLSGTGKTTLSADPGRALVGDDEHGWSDNGVFNFEGGCYAKLIRLSEEDEPAIFSTTRRPGSILENVVLNADGTPDFDNGSLTQNTRGSYPIEAIENRTPDSMAGNPKNVVFLTCDAFGVLPPLSKLSPEQAAYHFMSGYTAKVAGTEVGITEPEATFSTCFGAPFMPRHPSVYARLLSDKIRKNDSKCWLINTGWVAGGHLESSRIKIKWTRALLNAALDGDLDDVLFVEDERFGFQVPTTCQGVPDKILQPRQTWHEEEKFDNVADLLAQMFIDNFEQYAEDCSEEVLAAAPRVLG